MTFVTGIIAKYRGNLEQAGLLTPAMNRNGSSPAKGPAVLSKQTAAMRPSLTQAAQALRENPNRFVFVPVVQSPFQILFEETLNTPKIELLLIEAGEQRAEAMVQQLVKHGQEVLRDCNDKALAHKHLEHFFSTLAQHEDLLKQEDGLAQVIAACLNLWCCDKITDAAVEQLKAAIPGLEVVR